MASNDKILEDYLTRLMQAQYGLDEHEPLTYDELKRIALETGMQESEWEDYLARCDAYYQRGVAFNNQHNYQDAQQVLSKAVAINPIHIEANYELAKAWMHLAVEDEAHEQAKANFELYAKQVLTLEPVHEGAIRLRNEWQSIKKMEATEDKSRRRKLVIGAGIIVLLALLLHLFVTNGINTSKNAVDVSWAQVENVYQRRADLIPQLVSTVEAAMQYESETLKQLTAVAAEVRNQAGASATDDMQKYAAAQAQLGSLLDAAMAEAARKPALSGMENFLDLQTQIEGAENRITVERKKYNEAVQQYNTRVGAFPYSIYGYEPLPYYQVSANAFEVPDTAPSIE